MERKNNIVLLELQKNCLSKSLAVKTTCVTQYCSNLNPKGEDSSYKIDQFMATYISTKTKMGLTDIIFELHPHERWKHRFLLLVKTIFGLSIKLVMIIILDLLFLATKIISTTV